MYTEEQIKAKIRFAGTKKPSMDRRKQGHDYRSVNMYMITMHTEGWLRLFGTLEMCANPSALTTLRISRSASWVRL